MELRQSWIMTCFKGQLSLYELRIIVKIIEGANKCLEGVYLDKSVGRFKESCDDVLVSIPIRYLLHEDNEHYELVYKASLSLASRVVKFYDTKANVWMASPLIFDIKHYLKRGIISFRVYGRFYDFLYDFTRGFSRYDLEEALNLTCPAAVRLYMYLYGQYQPQSLSIEYLKNLFGVEDKYKQTGDFIKRVIVPAIEDINNNTSIIAEYHDKRIGKKIEAIVFKVQRKPDEKKNISLIKQSVLGIVGKDIELELVAGFGFTFRELSAHKVLLQRLMKHKLPYQLVADVCHRARKGNKGKGYVINALKKELAGM